ncbi:hypothetical protein N0V90_013353 [Kalmusia sp. IMI 367209]|nr:hypothetical protein N0V90_013353 [Kalmusia sp. IMI 367209]
MGLWLMGNDWMLWDRPSGVDQGNDYMTWQFLKDQESRKIPLVKEMRQIGEATDPFQFTLMSRAKGVPLDTVWRQSSQEEKQGYAKQVTEALRELRQFTSPVPQRVDGGPLWDFIIGRCHRGKCKHIGKTTEEWFDNMAEELICGLSDWKKPKDEATIEAEAKLQTLKENFPDGAPYVLTHADLNFSNIIVHDGKIEAFIDWELSGVDSDELWDIVWAELCPELDDEEFINKVFKAVTPVQNAYKACPITHSEANDYWLRPAFCECKPYGGDIARKDWDAELKHSVDYEMKARGKF